MESILVIGVYEVILHDKTKNYTKGYELRKNDEYFYASTELERVIKVLNQELKKCQR